MTTRVARRIALSDLSTDDIARLRWRLADAAFARGDRQAAREHALAATSPPKAGRPRGNERTPQPYTMAIRTRRDREIAERVEHWRALLVRERPKSRSRSEALRRNAEDVNDILQQRDKQAQEAGVRRGNPPDARGAGKPFEIATRIVAWELTHLKDPLTESAVRRALTRARAPKSTT